MSLEAPLTEQEWLTQPIITLVCDCCGKELGSGDKFQESISGSIKCIGCVLEELSEVE